MKTSSASQKEVSVLMNKISTGWTEVRCFIDGSLIQSEVVKVSNKWGNKSGGHHWVPTVLV